MSYRKNSAGVVGGLFFVFLTTFVIGCVSDPEVTSAQVDPCPVNWFAISAAFGKPQLGGFVASLATVGEEMSKQQAACQRPIASASATQSPRARGSGVVAFQYSRLETTALVCVYAFGNEVRVPLSGSCPSSISPALPVQSPKPKGSGVMAFQYSRLETTALVCVYTFGNEVRVPVSGSCPSSIRR